MAIVKANFTRSAQRAKASARYIENRPGKGSQRLIRTLFTRDGKVERRDVYAMIDQADQKSYFFRLVISPDPTREDQQRNLALREITEKTMQSLEHRFQQPLRWVAAIHADHADHRHVHALLVTPERLHTQDLYHLRGAATTAALEQLRRLELVREPRVQTQEQSPGLEIGLSW